MLICFKMFQQKLWKSSSNQAKNMFNLPKHMQERKRKRIELAKTPKHRHWDTVCKVPSRGCNWGQSERWNYSRTHTTYSYAHLSTLTPGRHNKGPFTATVHCFWQCHLVNNIRTDFVVNRIIMFLFCNKMRRVSDEVHSGWEWSTQTSWEYCLWKWELFWIVYYCVVKHTQCITNHSLAPCIPLEYLQPESQASSLSIFISVVYGLLDQTTQNVHFRRKFLALPALFLQAWLLSSSFE